MHLTDWMQFLLGVANALLPISSNPRAKNIHPLFSSFASTFFAGVSLAIHGIPQLQFLPVFTTRSKGCESPPISRVHPSRASHASGLVQYPSLHLSTNRRKAGTRKRMAVNGRRRRRNALTRREGSRTKQEDLGCSSQEHVETRSRKL